MERVNQQILCVRARVCVMISMFILYPLLRISGTKFIFRRGTREANKLEDDDTKGVHIGFG
jgi:hypothetical protein